MKIAGTEVKDVDEGLTVVITKTDVRKGSLKTAKACAAAQALCRQEGCDEARVHFSRAYIKRNDTWERYVVPPSLRNEVIAFDRGGTFAPGEYRLMPVQPSTRLDAKSKYTWVHPKKRKNKHPQKANRPKRPYHVVSGVRERMMADWE